MSETTKWEKLPVLAARGNPCVCCPPIGAHLHMDAVIAVGFGDAHVECDGDVIYTEPAAMYGTMDCAACDGAGFVDAYAATLTDCTQCKGLGYVDDPNAPASEYWEVKDAEAAALEDPDHDWRIVLNGPLHGETYQRQDTGQWMLVESNQGFA